MIERLFLYVIKAQFIFYDALIYPISLICFTINFHPLDKIKKRYGALGQVLCYSIDRGANTNVGISLAGHRDRNKMACFVAGINPKGAAKQTNLEVGDEILEVSLYLKHIYKWSHNVWTTE